MELHAVEAQDVEHYSAPQQQALAAVQAAQEAQQAEIAHVVNGAAAAIQAAAAVAAASAWATGLPTAATTAITEGSEGSLELDQKGGSTKMRRAAWTAEEEDRLKNLAERYASNGQRMCWRLIAQELATGRTSKQCREHYLNSLRPNMKKGQWTQREEYIIAREHAKNGSHWCIIAKKLPGRTDNSIKNFYNATVRSKAVNKNESFLWVYVDKVHRGHLPPKDAFAVATEIWSASVPPQVAQEVLNGAPDDGAEALMLLSGKRKADEDLEALLRRGPHLQQLVAQLGVGNLEELVKRQKLEGLVSSNAAATAAGLMAAAGLGQDRQRQELLQTLGLGPQQQQVGDLQILQQQILLQQLLAAANTPAVAAAAAPAGGNMSGGSAGFPGAAHAAANSNQLVHLMQQIAAQSQMQLQQQQHQPSQQPSAAGLQQLLSTSAGNQNNMLSQLLMTQDGGAAGHLAAADTAAAIAAAAAAAGVEVPVLGSSDIKAEMGGDNVSLHDPHMLQAAAAVAASAAAQAQHHALVNGADSATAAELANLASMANVSVDAVLTALPSGNGMVPSQQ